MNTRGKRRAALSRMQIIIIIVVAVVLIAAACVICMFAFRDTTGVLVELPFTESDNYCFTGDGFLYMEGTTVHYFDLNETDSSYSIPIGSTDVSLAGYGRTHVVYTETSITVLGSSFPIEFSGEVMSVKCSDSFIAVHKQENGVDTLRIFNNAGEQVDELSFGENHLTDYDFVKSGKTVQLYSVAVNVKASLPVSTVTTYNLNPQSISCIITVQNELIESVVFTSSSIFVVGSTNIIRYSRDGAYESYRLLCYGYCYDDSSVFDSSQKPITFVMHKNDADNLEMIRIYRTTQSDVADEYITSLQVPNNAVYAFTANGSAYVVTETSLLKYSTKGALSKSETLAYSPSSAEKLSDTQLLIAAGGRLFVQQIKP